MSIKHHTPIEADGIRLFYRTDYDVRKGNVGGHYRGPLFIPPKSNEGKGLFRLLDPDNVVAQMRLYRWFIAEHKRDLRRADGNFSGMILKDDLMQQCFDDWPSANKHRVGRLLRLIVQYETNFQNRSADGGMFWRWTHALDVVYGLEHLMLCWLPKVIEEDGGTVKTAEDYMEELEIIRGQTKEEDRELISTILDNKLM
jgi:hypothetical protein